MSFHIWVFVWFCVISWDGKMCLLPPSRRCYGCIGSEGGRGDVRRGLSWSDLPTVSA